MNPTDLLLRDQRVLIVGGGSRMGLATARRASNAGAHVILSSRSASRLEEASGTLKGEVSVHVADASVPEQAVAMFKALAPLDHIVVTASSGNVPAGGIPDTTPEIAQSAFARFWISYHVLHFAPESVKPSGSITLLSGSSGRRPGIGFGVWSALHGSIESLARAAAIELAPVRINVVSPGGIGIRSDRQLVHHAGQPDDVAAMILAVITNPAVTNTVIDVDGGERLGNWP